jgi:hypothetical protein
MATKEIRLNAPEPFNGNREDLVSFIQNCRVALSLNSGIYDTDEKQILYILSYMTSGTAKTWKEAYLDEILANKKPDFGKFDDFLKKIKEAFSSSDSEGEARAQLRQLRQGTGQVDDYIAQFRILAGRSKVTDNKALIEYFMEGIHKSILQKIFALETVPTTIKDWYEKASRFDSQYRRFQEISKRQTGPTQQTKKNYAAPRYVNHHHDPNAMDIDTTELDRLSIEEREQHMQERRCFHCHKIGHFARECRSKQTSAQNSKPSYVKPNTNYVKKYDGFKKTASTARAMIRNLVEDMDEEEKEKLIEEVVKDQDF